MEENQVVKQVFELLFTIFDYCHYFRIATNFNYAMMRAAKKGRIDIVKQCKEYGATDFNWALENAAKNGHIEIVKLLKEWATNWAMAPAA